MDRDLHLSDACSLQAHLRRCKGGACRAERRLRESAVRRPKDYQDADGSAGRFPHAPSAIRGGPTHPERRGNQIIEYVAPGLPALLAIARHNQQRPRPAWNLPGRKLLGTTVTLAGIPEGRALVLAVH